MGLRKGGLYVRYYAFKIRHHISVGKAQDLIAFGSAVIITVDVICGCLVMAVAIDFDDQPEFSTQEIGKVGANWHLSAEFIACFASTQLLPQ